MTEIADQAAPARADDAPAAENPPIEVPRGYRLDPTTGELKRKRGRPPRQPGAPKAPYNVRPSKLSTEPLTDDELPTALVQNGAVKRDQSGRWVKGGAPTTGGKTRAQARVARLLEDATPASIRRIVELVQSPNESIALEAAKFIVSRVAAPPPREPKVAVAVQVNSAEAHMAALRAVAERRIAESGGAMLPAPARPAVHVTVAEADDAPGNEPIDVEAEEAER